MSTVRHLSHAPITEAVIDFRVEAPPSFDVRKIQQVLSEFSEEYPVLEEMRTYSGGLQFVDGRIEHSAQDQGVSGVALRAARLDRVVQFRVDGYTFSKLKPYTDWASVRNEAIGFWQLYMDVVGIRTITRTAVRYINQFSLSPHRVSRALVMRPEVPETFSSSDLTASLYRLVLNDRESAVRSRVTVAIEPDPEVENSVNTILDIDCSLDIPFSAGDPHLERLEKLHEMKNRIFFGSLTDDLIEEFE